MRPLSPIHVDEENLLLDCVPSITFLMLDSIFLFSLLLVSLCPNPGEKFPLNMLFSDLELDYFTRRNRYFNSKRCNRTCSPTGSSIRFLQYTFSGSEEERKNETCNKFETPQQVSQENSFQNGHFSS
jgi:hypothetical protein